MFLKCERFIGEGMTGMAQRFPSSLHCFAGVLLSLFALSHLAFLRISGFEGGLPNPVFPFFSNNDLYLAAAIFEGFTALACFRFHGRDFTNMIILAFIATILWYRWAFRFTGGSHCGCMGLLGRLLHVSKRHEKIIGNLVLFYLAFTTIPWLYSTLRAVGRRVAWKLPLGLVMVLGLQPIRANGDLRKVIEVYGEYNTSAQNPKTGRAYVQDPRHVHAAFCVVICGNAWKITATNLSDISDPTIGFVLKKSTVGQIWSDGTNTFTMEPAHGQGAYATTNIVTASPTPFYLESFDPDFLEMSLPWLTYCLSTNTSHPDKNGHVTQPVPWLQPRFSPMAYGFRWIISPTADGEFISKLTLVRDHALDLSDGRTLLRTDFVYPNSLAAYERDENRLKLLKTIPNGFVQAKFTCLDWYFTNEASIPAESELQQFEYNPSQRYRYPVFEGRLTAAKIVLRNADVANIFPKVTQPTQVVDFRYRRASRSRIYRYAEYTLQPGESWKSADDAVLLAQAARYLKYGPRYDFFLSPHKRNYLAWLLLVGVMLIPAIAVLWKKHKT